MRLLLSIYKTDIWKFGKDGVYFALGPLRFSQKTLLEALEDSAKTRTSVLEQTVDYEYEPSLHTDTFKLYLKDGTSVKREFGRTTQINREEGTRESQISSTALTFRNKLQERCGY